MKIFLLPIILIIIKKLYISSVNGIEVPRWEQYKIKYKKNYNNSYNEVYYKNIWEERLKLIERHNKRAQAGLETYYMGENEFSDIPLDDLKKMTLGLGGNTFFNGRKKKRSFSSSFSLNFYQRPKSLVLPLTYDARNVTINGKLTSIVPPVKNQNACGSCYVYAAIDAMSAQYRLKYGTMINLSAQEIIDCSKQWGNEGCDGGSMDNVYRYAWDNEGVISETAYPKNVLDGNCVINKTISKRYIATTGMIRLQNNEINIRAALVNKGPLAIGMNGGLFSFYLYSNGIYSDLNCTSTDLNHAALLIGFGTDIINGVSIPYWLIKNSWGTSWGLGGYVKILRDSNNICGVMSQPSYPIIY